MTPKEKAEELMMEFISYADDSMASLNDNARYCALICVNEIIEEVREFVDDNYHSNRMIYWNEVKQELEKL